MADENEIFKALEKDGGLREKLAGMWANGSTAEEIAAALSEAGLATDASQVEELLAKLQKKQGEDIGFEDVDPEQLDKLAGGGTGIDCSQADDCDENYKDPEYWGQDRCQYSELCDEYAAVISKCNDSEIHHDYVR